MKTELPGLLKALMARHRLEGAPKVPLRALAAFLGIHSQTLYLILWGELRVSDGLTLRLMHVLGEIGRGELVFEKVPGIRRWQGRHVTLEERAKRNISKLLSGKIDFTAAGPRTRLIKFP